MKRYFFILFLIINVMANETKIIKENNKEIVIEVRSDYVLGDSDTRINAKNIALQQAKMLASEYAGSYVKSELVIENNKIKKEQISTITTALMSLKVIKEKYTITKNDRTKLRLVVDAKLDKQSFINKIKSLYKNKAKLKQIVLLEKENRKLRKQLKELNKQIKNIKINKQAKYIKTSNEELIKAREKVLSKLEINENSIKKIFKRGTLFAMALKSGNNYQEALNDIDINVFQYIKHNLKVSMDNPKFVDNGNGTYNVEILLHWKINAERILKTLNKYFWDYNKKLIRRKDHANFFESIKNSYIEINEFSNEKNKKKLPYSDKLYYYLTNKIITIKVKIANFHNYLIIGAVDNKFDGCNGCCYKIELNNLKYPNEIYFSQNPIVIKNIPKNVLENATSIETKVKIFQKRHY
jgi:hypothetical protein